MSVCDSRLINIGGIVKRYCYPTGDSNGPLIVVMQGDLTACKVDAIVNAANSQLAHGGGLAGAIVRRGGQVIQDESFEWIQQHGSLNVGTAMSTTAGKLPCGRVIHTVGPCIPFNQLPSEDDARLLRSAVWGALIEAERLGLSSVAIPGISTGIFGYPVDLGAAEIVSECVRFCRERPMTTLRIIVLMNIDDSTVSNFVNALKCIEESL